METMKIKGYGATVTFDGETITIDRAKFGNSIVGIEQTVIPMCSVVDVSLGKATLFTNGLFCVSVMLPNGESSRLYTKATQAQITPYSTIYSKQQAKDFERLFEAVKSCIPVNPKPIEHDQTNETKFARSQAKSENLHAKLLQLAPQGSHIQKFKGADGTIIDLYEHQIWCGREKHDLRDVTASVEDGSALESRVTVTRLLLAGPFALAFKKKGGEKYVTIEGPDFAWIAEANRKHIKDAVMFANMVNNQVRRESANANAGDNSMANDAPMNASMVATSTTTPVASTTSTDTNIADELAKLAQLHNAGVLSDEEFNAAKKKALGI